MIKTTGKCSIKTYKCTRCGTIQKHNTNHWGEIYPRCKGCSWKNPMEPMIAMECLEVIPDGYNMPPKWKTAKLGDICEIIEGKRKT